MGIRKIKGIACLALAIVVAGSFATINNIAKKHTSEINELETILRSNEKEYRDSNESLEKEVEELRIKLEKSNDDLSLAKEDLSAVEKKILENQKKKSKILTVEVSAYCPCVICCGEWSTKNYMITASGTRMKPGTIAAPKELEFGTQMKIRSFGDRIFTVEDTGSYIKKVDGVYRLDIFVPTHSEALNIGRYKDKALIIN